MAATTLRTVFEPAEVSRPSRLAISTAAKSTLLLPIPWARASVSPNLTSAVREL
jgi:hypothetical protein